MTATQSKALQMWACLTCDTERQWGHGQPLDEHQLPTLQCEGDCSINARRVVEMAHRFAGVSFRGWAV